MGKPKASRPANLAKDYTVTVNALLDVMDKLSAVLAADVNHKDATIDQLLAVKQIAWLLRNTAGEASLIISTGLSSGKMTPEIKANYGKFLGGIDIGWNALELTAAGMQLPPALSSALAANKTAYFDREYLSPSRSVAERAARWREARVDPEPVLAHLGRSAQRRRRRRRSRARCRQGARGHAKSTRGEWLRLIRAVVNCDRNEMRRHSRKVFWRI
ncbi:hypothetical protein RAD15_06020 [Bradyrhizobium sp. 14AA]